MIGNNEMILNTATMIKALQEYLNQRWDETSSGDKCPQVIDVAQKDYASGLFVVSLKSE